MQLQFGHVPVPLLGQRENLVDKGEQPADPPLGDGQFPGLRHQGVQFSRLHPNRVDAIASVFVQIRRGFPLRVVFIVVSFRRGVRLADGGGGAAGVGDRLLRCPFLAFSGCCPRLRLVGGARFAQLPDRLQLPHGVVQVEGRGFPCHRFLDKRTHRVQPAQQLIRDLGGRTQPVVEGSLEDVLESMGHVLDLAGPGHPRRPFETVRLAHQLVEGACVRRLLLEAQQGLVHTLEMLVGLHPVEIADFPVFDHPHLRPSHDAPVRFRHIIDFRFVATASRFCTPVRVWLMPAVISRIPVLMEFMASVTCLVALDCSRALVAI